MQYTFYADLLGIGSYYRLGSKVAYEKLNCFYNTAWQHLSLYCQENSHVQVLMLSDSLLVYGGQAEEMLMRLSPLYRSLIEKSLLLRGGMVADELRVDPRNTLSNFAKLLPGNESLARAAGLEKTQKGARLLIEPALAEGLLGGHEQWMTHEGYMDHVYPHVEVSSILRRICPTPDNQSYEFLYFWEPNGGRRSVQDYSNVERRLTAVMDFVGQPGVEHYRETLALLKRCKSREHMTLQRLSGDNQECPSGNDCF